MDEHCFGGHEVCPANLLRLISELEGSYQFLKYMGFEEDMRLLDELKKKYYKKYFQLVKDSKTNVASLV